MFCSRWGAISFGYSIATPAALMMSKFALKSASSCISISPGVCTGTMALTAQSFFLKSSFLASSTILAFSLVTISFGRPAGP